MSNYATQDVYGTDPDTGRRILIASAGAPIPADLDSQVSGGNKTSTAPTQPAQPNRETKTLTTTLPATGAAADYDQVLGEAPFAGDVIAASYVPEANVTGNTAESRAIRVINKGGDGNGTTVVATLAFQTGVNADDFDEKALVVSSVAGAPAVAAGDVLAVASVHTGSSGLADPGGQVQVHINPR